MFTIKDLEEATITHKINFKSIKRILPKSPNVSSTKENKKQKQATKKNNQKTQNNTPPQKKTPQGKQQKLAIVLYEAIQR